MILMIALFPGAHASDPRVIRVRLERVAGKAVAGGDGGNQWGGHQCRIVETEDGIFTAYTRGGKDHFKRRWHLMQRFETGWKQIASEESGREPVNLMAGPDGTLYIAGWPEYRGTLWCGKPSNGRVEFRREDIPAVYVGSHPYNSAAIDSCGNIVVLSSVEDSDNHARFQWAYRNASTGEWTGRISFLDYRHCYTYIFPHQDGSIRLVSTRDVRWETLNYVQPPGTFAYVFNAYRYWIAEDFEEPLRELAFSEEKPTQEFPFVECRALNDVFEDSEGNMHVLYTRRGLTTTGERVRFHAVYGKEGDEIYHSKLHCQAGSFARVFQDSYDRFLLLNDTGMLYLLEDSGYMAVDSVQIDLGSYAVNYSGFGLSVPRTGSVFSGCMHVVFPSGNGKQVVYFCLKPEDIFPDEKAKNE